MTKKDYVLLARAFNDTLKSVRNSTTAPFVAHGVLINLIGRLCDDLARDNPNFRRVTFYEACTK